MQKLKPIIAFLISFGVSTFFSCDPTGFMDWKIMNESDTIISVVYSIGIDSIHHIKIPAYSSASIGGIGGGVGFRAGDFGAQFLQPFDTLAVFINVTKIKKDYTKRKSWSYDQHGTDGTYNLSLDRRDLR